MHLCKSWTELKAFELHWVYGEKGKTAKKIDPRNGTVLHKSSLEVKGISYESHTQMGIG